MTVTVRVDPQVRPSIDAPAHAAGGDRIVNVEARYFGRRRSGTGHAGGIRRCRHRGSNKRPRHPPPLPRIRRSASPGPPFRRPPRRARDRRPSLATAAAAAGPRAVTGDGGIRRPGRPARDGRGHPRAARRAEARPRCGRGESSPRRSPGAAVRPTRAMASAKADVGGARAGGTGPGATPGAAGIGIGVSPVRPGARRSAPLARGRRGALRRRACRPRSWAGRRGRR